ncbi:MAG: hypothetical protein ACI9SE_002047 [Neolewinella sp.]|jgi:hypothetical protein
MDDIPRYSMMISSARGNTVWNTNELVPSIVTAVAKNVMRRGSTGHDHQVCQLLVAGHMQIERRTA